MPTTPQNDSSNGSRAKSIAQTGFIDAAAKRDFVVLSVATFLIFLSFSQLNLLAVVLSSNGFNDVDIGSLLSSSLPIVVLTMLSAGKLLGKFGAKKVASTGTVLMIVGFMSLEILSHSYPGVIFARAISTIGYALFMPSAMAYADSKLNDSKRAYLFGLFSSTIPLPTIAGPWLAERYIQSYGPTGLFLAGIVPAALGLALLFSVSVGPPPSRRIVRWRAYTELLTRRDLAPPYIGILLVGVLFGFLGSFMALTLHRHSIGVASFFLCYMLAFFVTRFVILRVLAKLAKSLVIAIGVGFISLGFLVLAVDITPITVPMAAIPIGLGYSAAFPTLMALVTERFKVEERGIPIVLFNLNFAVGSNVIPIAGGLLLSFFGEGVLIAVLAVCAALVAAFSFLQYATAREPAYTVPK